MPLFPDSQVQRVTILSSAESSVSLTSPELLDCLVCIDGQVRDSHAACNQKDDRENADQELHQIEGASQENPSPTLLPGRGLLIGYCVLAAYLLRSSHIRIRFCVSSSSVQELPRCLQDREQRFRLLLREVCRRRSSYSGSWDPS